jgi:hypothetical protein
MSTYTFETYGAFLNHVEHAPCAPAVRARSSRLSDAEHSAAWSGTDTFEEALTLARDGWAEGAERAREITGALVSAIGSQIEIQDIAYSYTGAFVDINKALEGEPECCGNFENVLVDGPSSRLLHIVYNIAASYGISAATIESRGASIVALVELMEQAGIRCKVTAVSALTESTGAVQTDKITTSTRVTVKAYDQTVDSYRLAFMLAHPAALRRLMFSAAEIDPEHTASVNYAYGHPADCPPKERGDVYIERMLSGPSVNWNDPGSCQAWIVATLKAQGISINATYVAQVVSSYVLPAPAPRRPVTRRRRARRY